MEVVVDELVHGPRRFSDGVIAGEGDCRDDYACWFDEEVLCRLGPGIRWQAEDAYSKGVEEGHDDEAQTSENKEEAEMTTGLGTPTPQITKLFLKPSLSKLVASR